MMALRLDSSSGTVCALRRLGETQTMREVTTMKKLAMVLLGVLTSVAWLLPMIAEARLAANHNETLLADL
jgi:hypothetical protein